MIVIVKNVFLRLICLLFLPVVSFGQSSDYESSAYVWFDNTIGKTNTDIFNGLEYVEKHRTLNDQHKFFLNPDFTNGSVVFNEQPYFNLRLKYDLFEDQLLLRYSDEPNTPTILLDKSKITKFYIDKYEFENFNIETDKGEKWNGFFEVLMASNRLKLFKRNHKKIRTKTNEQIRYFEFKDQNSYIIFHQGKYYHLNNLNGLSKIFPNQKNLLKQKEGVYKAYRKDYPDTYLRLIFEDLIKEISKTSSEE